MCVEGHAMPMGLSLLLSVLYPRVETDQEQSWGKQWLPEPVFQKKYLPANSISKTALLT